MAFLLDDELSRIVLETPWLLRALRTVRELDPPSWCIDCHRPGAELHLGLGLWQSMPTGWWFVELAFIAGCLTYYRARASQETVDGFDCLPADRRRGRCE